jgi:hypothetical protein
MKQLTIATYNIRHGCNVRMDWNRLAEIIRMSHADMVGIQEVDMLTNRTGGADTIQGLTEATGLPYALYIPAMDFDGGQYGTAILSRYPITFSEIHPLESGSFEPRAFGAVTVSPEEGLTIHFLIADAAGKSLCIEYIHNVMSVIPTPVMTNHYLTPGPYFGQARNNSIERYDTLSAFLAETPAATPAQVLAAMTSVLHGTQWTAVYDQSALLADFYQKDDFDTPVRLRL